MPRELRNVDPKQYPYECCVCHRPLKKKVSAFKNVYCTKHYNQMKKYGHVLDDNPRTIFDKNDIYVQGDIAYVELYDIKSNYVATAKIDKEDIIKILPYKWRFTHGYAHVANRKTKSLMMHKIIMNTDEFVDHINHDTLDNRKCNLRIVTKSQNAINMRTAKGYYLSISGSWSARIKLNQKIICLGNYEHEEEAMYARWYAEQLLFKEYAYKKEEPVLPDFLKEKIREYVNQKVQRL